MHTEIRAAAFEMDKKRHVIHFTDGRFPATKLSFWFNTTLKMKIGQDECQIQPQMNDIDYYAEATFVGLMKHMLEKAWEKEGYGGGSGEGSKRQRRL